MSPASPNTIPWLFRQQALAHPARVALVYGESSVSYAQLDAWSDALALALQGRGVRPGHVVALHMARSLEMTVAMLGLAKLGAAYMPLDLANPVARSRYCLQTAHVQLILTDRDASALCDAECSSWQFTVAQLQAAAAPVQPLQPLSGDTAAYVMFTSGTTAAPKGVVVPHRGVTRLVVDTNFIRISPQDAILQFSAPSFDASTFEIWGALLNGATLVLYTGEVLDPNLFRRHITEHGVTILWLTAALFHLFAHSYLDALRPLRVLVAGGDVLHPGAVNNVLDSIDGITLINGYGPTENTTFTCCHVMDKSNKPTGPVPIGLPITGTQVFVLDEQRRAVAPGEVGELYAGGLGVALGYLNASGPDSPFLHDQRLADGLLYRTGDLVRVGRDGVIEFIGRRDSQVKLRGYRVSLDEIKLCLMEIPSVKEAAVSALKRDDGDQLLVAYLQVEEGQAVDLKAVRRHLGARVPAYMIPERITIGTTLPINTNGKIDKAQIFPTLISM